MCHHTNRIMPQHIFLNNDNIEQLNKWVKASYKIWRLEADQLCPSSVKWEPCLVGLYSALLLQYEKAMVCRNVLSKACA